MFLMWHVMSLSYYFSFTKGPKTNTIDCFKTFICSLIHVVYFYNFLLEIIIFIILFLRFEFYFSIKWFLTHRSRFIFCLLAFLSSTYCDVFLL